MIFICVISLILIKTKYIIAGYYFFLLFATLADYYEIYLLHSAYSGTMLVINLLLCAFLKDKKITTIMFISDMVVIAMLIMMGVLTIVQNFDPQTKIPLVNNILVLVPLLIIIYLYTLINGQKLLEIVERQKMEYNLYRKSQDQIINQEKLETISVLAGGIAHDFNNLLVSILGNISLLEMNENLKSEVSEILHDIENASIQARNLANQLMTFSKGGEPNKTIITNLNQIIIETVNFSLRGRKSQPKFLLNNNLWPIQADKNQFTRIVQNLVINADESMSTGDYIEITASNEELSNKFIPNLSTGPYVKIEVLDHGAGINPDNYKNIFQPFYSTKKEGNGLGLAICYSIMKKHQGSIQFESKINQGTKFSLFFPHV